MTTPQDTPQKALARLAAHAPLPPLHPVSSQASPPPPSVALHPAIRQLLYYSEASEPWSESRLVELLEQARPYNHQHAITGLLLYQAGRFVQFLEGEATAIETLYAQIQADPRHHHVVLAHQQNDTVRFFADWAMAFVSPEANEFYWLLDYLEARQHRLLIPQIPITEPHLLTLLEALQHCC